MVVARPEAARAGRGLVHSTAALLRENMAFAAIFAVGLAMRVLAMIAYPPALFFGDSWGYIDTAFSGHPVALSNIRPSGYPALMWLLTLPSKGLVQLVAVQHAAGLAVGTLVYIALIRARIPKLAAAAAAALILLDGYAIALEQHLMPEPLFTITLLVATLLAIWQTPKHKTTRAALVGLLLAAATLQRTVALFTIPLFLAYLLWTRTAPKPAAAFALALAAPLLIYAAEIDSSFGTFGLTQTSGWIAYGRVAGFADCSGAGIAPAARPLCETASQRRSHPTAPTWYIFAHDSPAVRLFGGYGKTAAAERHSNSTLRTFAKDIALHQPLDYAGAVGADVVRYFTPGTAPFDDQVSATALPKTARQEFQDEYIRRRLLPGVHPTVQSPAGFMRAYRNVIHIPRPILALLALASLAALTLRTPRRKEILLLSGSGLALLVGAAATAGFGIRYLIPSVPLLAIGGTLAARDLYERVAG